MNHDLLLEIKFHFVLGKINNLGSEMDLNLDMVEETGEETVAVGIIANQSLLPKISIHERTNQSFLTCPLDVPRWN